MHSQFMYVIICRRFRKRQLKFAPNFDEIIRRNIRKNFTFGGQTLFVKGTMMALETVKPSFEKKLL